MNTGLEFAICLTGRVASWATCCGSTWLLMFTLLTLCLVLVRLVEGQELLKVLLSGQPAPTTPEAFCRPLRADDRAEAQERAGLLLKVRSLAAYSDEVASKALQLATNHAYEVVPEDELDPMEQSLSHRVTSNRAMRTTIPGRRI